MRSFFPALLLLVLAGCSSPPEPSLLSLFPDDSDLAGRPFFVASADEAYEFRGLSENPELQATKEPDHYSEIAVGLYLTMDPLPRTGTDLTRGKVVVSWLRPLGDPLDYPGMKETQQGGCGWSSWVGHDGTFLVAIDTNVEGAARQFFQALDGFHDIHRLCGD